MVEVPPYRVQLGYRCARRPGRRGQGPEGPGRGLEAPCLAPLAAHGQALWGPGLPLLHALLLLHDLLLPAQRDLQSSMGWQQADMRVGGWLAGSTMQAIRQGQGQAGRLLMVAANQLLTPCRVT